RQSAKKKKFIAALAEVPSVKHAAQRAGVDRTTIYMWRKQDRDFAAAWRESLDQSVYPVDCRAFDIAMHGDPDSNVLGQMIQLILKAHRRETYGDKSEVAFMGGLVIVPAKRGEGE